jgi:hypothetical protein
MWSSYYHYDLIDNLKSVGNLKTQENRNAIYTEIEAVIYCSMSTLDILSQEINARIKIGLNEKEVNVFSIRKKLEKSTSEKAKKIFQVLDKLLNSATFKILQELRNQITHRSILEELNIGIHPPLTIFPDIGSRAFKKVTFFEGQPIRIDRIVEHKFEINPDVFSDEEDLPDGVGKLRFLVWKGYDILDIVENALYETIDTVTRIEEIIDE